MICLDTLIDGLVIHLTAEAPATSLLPHVDNDQCTAPFFPGARLGNSVPHHSFCHPALGPIGKDITILLANEMEENRGVVAGVAQVVHQNVARPMNRPEQRPMRLVQSPVPVEKGLDSWHDCHGNRMCTI